MNKAIKTSERLKDMMRGQGRPLVMGQVLKSDLASVLKNYFAINESDISLKIEAEGDVFVVSMLAHASHIKALNYLK